MENASSNPSEALDLGQFLARQGSQGQWDSEGAITVDHGRALRTLGRFSLPFDYAWVLRVVQAAVAWGSPGLELRRYRGFTVFEFCPQANPTEAELVEALLSVRPAGHNAVDLLAQGLRALVEQTGLSFRLQISQNRVIQAGRDAAALERLVAPWKLEPFPGLRLQVLHLALAQSALARYLPEWAMAERPDLRISSVLDEHAFLCPIPIRVDGRRVDGLLEHSRWGFPSGLRPVLLSALPFQAQAQRVVSLHAHPRRARRHCRDFAGFANWFYVRAHQARDEPSWDRQLASRQGFPVQWVLYLSYGVIVERVAIKIASRQSELLVVLDASGLETDLGGFAPRRTDGENSQLRHWLAEVSDQLRRLASGTSFIKPDTDEKSLTDSLEIRRAAASLKRARALIPKASSLNQERLAGLFSAGVRMLRREIDPPDVPSEIAGDWEAGLRRDLVELSALEMAPLVRGNGG